MERKEYEEILKPVFDLVVDQFIYNEEKHGEGIFTHPMDAVKAAGHALSSYRNIKNDEPFSHAVAAASRSAKVILSEINSEK